MSTQPTTVPPEHPGGIRYIYPHHSPDRTMQVPAPDLSDLNFDLVIPPEHFPQIIKEYQEKYWPDEADDGT